MEADWKAIRSTWPWRTASAQLKIPSVCQGRDTKDSSAHGGNSLTFLEWLVNWFTQAESHYSLPESKILHTNISLCFRGALFHKKVTLEKEYIPYETTTSRQHLKVWNNDVSMKLLRSNQNGKDQSGANQPSVDWGGGVTGGQKDEWAWLVGWEPPGLSMLGEKPGHSAERESRKEGQEMRTRSNPERQNCVKKIYPPPALLQERNPHPSSCSRGQVRQGYVAVCPSSSDMPPAFTTQHFKAAHLGTVRDGVGIMLAQQAKSHAPSLQQRSWSDLWPLGLPHILLPFPFFHLTVSCLFNLYSPSAPCKDCTINFMDMY